MISFYARGEIIGKNRGVLLRPGVTIAKKSKIRGTRIFRLKTCQYPLIVTRKNKYLMKKKSLFFH